MVVSGVVDRGCEAVYLEWRMAAIRFVREETTARKRWPPIGWRPPASQVWPGGQTGERTRFPEGVRSQPAVGILKFGEGDETPGE